MATTANLSSIIRFYAEKQKSPFIDFVTFCAYVKKYAEHHVENSPDLVKYLGDPTDIVAAELKGLSEKRIATLSVINKKRIIISVAYCSLKYAKIYDEIIKNNSIPYPAGADLPKDFPPGILEEKDAAVYIKEVLEKQDLKSTALYVLKFEHEIPAVLMPASVSVDVIIESAKEKIRRILKKDEYHDYYLKKLRDSNAGKELIIQTFFENFVHNKNQPTDINQVLSSDDYYYWNQLCYYIRKEFEKIQDKTIDDNNILQAIEFTEIYNIYLKQKMQQEQRRAEALKELSLALNKPPYIYTMDQILKFKDQGGRLLYGQFSEEDLKEFMQRESSDSETKELPHLLNFKIDSGTRYFIFKNNIIPFIVRQCNEAHNSVEKKIEEKWYRKLLNYEKLPEMSSAKLFEELLQREVEETSPILWALLNANFITLLSYEKNDGLEDAASHIFNGNNLLPYTDLLMLKSSDILAQAKMRLPFYYTLPIISWILALFSSKKKKSKANKKVPQKSESSAGVDEIELDEDEEKSKTHKARSPKEKLADMAEELAKEFVPEGSTIDRELDFLCTQWNKMLGTEARINLTDDVNSLIRDYMRKVVSTLSTSTFTSERVKNLARTLVRTPNMQKIKDEGPLTQYVELYILKLVSNR